MNNSPDTPWVGGLPGELSRIRSQIRTMSQTLMAARRSDELMDTVAEIESLRSSLDALQLGVVRELEATHAVKPIGWASTQDFVTSIAGGHKGAGPAIVRLAQAVDTPVLAPVGEALSDGWLSLPQAQVISRVIDDLPGHLEVRERAVALLLDEAKRLDATDLRRIGRHLISHVDPDGQARRDEQALDREERSAHLGRDFWMRFDGAGGFGFGGRGSAEDGAKLRTTLMSLSKPRPAAGPVCDPETCDVPGCWHDGRDPRDHGARTFDAVIELCDLAARATLLPESHRVIPRVSVTMDFEGLKGRSGYGTTDTGEELPAETVRRMACDADIIPVVLGAQGEVLDVGHQQRLVSPAIWKALVVRDRHCRFPNCTRPPVMTHAHHIVHWCDGGPTSLANMILLCGHHHRLVHAGPWCLRRTGANAFVFDPPVGTRRMNTTGREPPDD